MANELQGKKKNFLLAYFQGQGQYLSGHNDVATLEALYLRANPQAVGGEWNNRRKKLDNDCQGS